MKKWYGGLLILALGMLLILLYGLIGMQPQKQSVKQSAYSFFNNHTPNNSAVRNNLTINSSDVKIRSVPKPTKRPHSIHIQGLDDLSDMKDFSEGELKVMIVWTPLFSLLSRSDALPETAQGVKEASVAWKELLSTIEKEKASRISKIDSPENQNCPLTVTALGKRVPSSGVILELPCGLVVDSSITLIGIPNGQNRSFQIDLVGQQKDEEPNPPIILHYNVSLPGENLTEDPFIVQNTWTNDLGWGKEERCPAHSSANILEGIFSKIFIFNQESSSLLVNDAV